jgi:hypothetical protein
MTTEEAIKGLAEEARRVGKQHAAQVSAWENEMQAKAELLAAVIHAIGPALEAISGRVEIEQAGNGTMLSPAPFRGVRIAGGLSEACAIYLTEHGVLMKVEYIWSNGRDWRGKWAPVNARYAITEFEVEGMIDRLAAVLEQQKAGSAQKRTAQLETRAAQLRTMVLALRGMK